jgi:hypothetical protein
LPFFDFYCPDEKREKKETPLPPPPPIEVSQPDQDRMKRQIEELKEIKAKYDKGEITKEEFEAKSASRCFDLMGGSVGEQLTKNIEKVQQMEDVARVLEFMRARVKVVGGGIKVEAPDANAERVRCAQEKLAESWRGINPMELFMTEAGGKILAEKIKENIAMTKELADVAKAGMSEKPKDDSKQCKKK